MIRYVRPLHLRALGAISPSSAATMRVCRLRLHLRLNADRAEAAPPATAAVIGTVAHDMMAQVRRGALADVPDGEVEQWLADEWTRRISAGHARMQYQAIAGEVPPPSRWRNYFMTRARLLRVLATIARTWRPSSLPGGGTATEKELESPDGILCGRLDRVERDPDGAHIVDLKTSQPQSPEMRPEHREQLLIYGMCQALHPGAGRRGDYGKKLAGACRGVRVGAWYGRAVGG